MAERYQRLFTLPASLYTSGSPVWISAGALLRDTQSGRLLAQLKLKNLDPRTIKAVKVRVTALDTVRRTLGAPTEHAYLDLDVPRDAEFGQKSPIVLPDAETRAFSAVVTEVAFSDNTIWTAKTDAVWTSLQEPQPLEEALSDDELVKQYKLRFGEDCKFLPVRRGDLWRCACGAVNRADEPVCHACGKVIDTLFAVDMKALTAEKDARLAREKAEREAEEKAAAEAAAKAAEARRIKAEAAKKTGKKVLKIAIPALIAVIAAALVVTKIVIPNGEYTKAVQLMEDGKYDEAIAAFKAMDGYKDSNAMIEQAAGKRAEAATQKKYEDAVAMMDKGEYSSAKAQFVVLGDYKDSADLAADCEARALLSSYQNGEPVGLAELHDALTDPRLHRTGEMERVLQLTESLLEQASALQGSYIGPSYQRVNEDYDYRVLLDISETAVQFAYERLDNSEVSNHYRYRLDWMIQDGQLLGIFNIDTSTDKYAETVIPTPDGITITSDRPKRFDVIGDYTRQD